MELRNRMNPPYNVVIYNINSFGGNYAYSIELAEAYSLHPDVKSVALIQPENAAVKRTGVHKILIKDIYQGTTAILGKVHFLYRSLVNPFRLFAYLRKAPPSVVLLNDFDQLTSFVWAPFLRRLKKKHLFAILVHDPDRDAYFPIRGLSRWTMRQVLSIADIAFFHGAIPNKSYYNNTALIKKEVPHGIFREVPPSPVFLKELYKEKVGYKLLGLLGNIREEKNYELILEAMADLPDCKILIAGKLAHSSVPIDRYKNLIEKHRISDRVIWLEKYLTDAEMSAAIQACDLMIMYYKPSFVSQSGILNKIAPFKKPVIVTDAESTLNQKVTQYKLGISVKPNNVIAFIDAVNAVLPNTRNEQQWGAYCEEASWGKHVSISIEAYKQLITSK